jgi:YHS domain-containing protein
VVAPPLQAWRRMRAKADEAVFDPICGDPVSPGASLAVEYRKRKYFFCSEHCKERFEHQAERTRMKDLARMGALFANEKVRWGVA